MLLEMLAQTQIWEWNWYFPAESVWTEIGKVCEGGAYSFPIITLQPYILSAPACRLLKKHLREIYVSILTNPCNNIEKSMYQLWQIHKTTLTNPTIWTKFNKAIDRLARQGNCDDNQIKAKLTSNICNKQYRSLSLFRLVAGRENFN